MEAAVADPAQQAALEKISAGFADLRAAGFDPADARDAVTLVEAVECIHRQAHAATVGVMDHIGRRSLHRADGHTSAANMVRHVGQVANAAARRRHKVVCALRALPHVRAAFEEGRIGIDQVERISRAYANPRIRAAFMRRDEECARLAQDRSYYEFHLIITAWCRLMDQDGTEDQSRHDYQNREFLFLQDFGGGGWSGNTRCGSIEGAEINEILRAFERAEWEADWKLARAQHGPDAIDAHLPRTPAQRRFDAFRAMCLRAADGRAFAPGGSRIETVIVMDQHTFDDQLARLTGAARTAPDEPLHPDAHGPGEGRRCSTLDGHQIDPAEAALAALQGHVRRAVIGAKGVVLDMGRDRRLFTGPAALALKLGSTVCSLAGCEVRVTACQGGHLVPYGDRGGGGLTNQNNGGPECDHHNHWKEALGLVTYRDDGGRWHTLRPDGSEI